MLEHNSIVFSFPPERNQIASLELFARDWIAFHTRIEGKEIILAWTSRKYDIEEDFSTMNASQLRILLQQKILISQKYKIIHGARGCVEYSYVRRKEDNFKTPKAKVLG